MDRLSLWPSVAASAANPDGRHSQRSAGRCRGNGVGSAGGFGSTAAAHSPVADTTDRTYVLGGAKKWDVRGRPLTSFPFAADAVVVSPVGGGKKKLMVWDRPPTIHPLAADVVAMACLRGGGEVLEVLGWKRSLFCWPPSALAESARL